MSTERKAGLLALALAFLLVWGCRGDGSNGPPPQTPPVPVRVAEAKTRSVFRGVETVGTLMPDTEVVVSAEVSGPLARVLAEEGDRVKRGDVLAVVEETEYRLRLREAEAAYAQSQAELARKETLFREAIISQQQYDDVKARFALAKARRDLARERLRKTQILAPIAGRVKARKVSAGEYVRPGTPLFVLIRTHPLKLVATVPEKEAARIRKGQRVRLQVDIHPGRVFKGHVSLVAPHVDETTRTLRIEARVPNPRGELKAGLFARAMILFEAQDPALLVPAVAVRQEDGTQRVFVVDGDTVRKVRVRVGKRFGADLEILQGLRPGDRVVVAGHQELADGTHVRIVP